MKKRIFAILGLAVALAGPDAGAQGFSNAAPMRIVVPYETSCSSITISSVTPTEVSGNTIVKATSVGISFVKVTAQDTTGTLYCSHMSSVTASGARTGESIPGTSGVKNWLSWPISPVQLWYCIGSAVGLTAQVCRVR